jgi:hypothetical protein
MEKGGFEKKKSVTLALTLWLKHHGDLASRLGNVKLLRNASQTRQPDFK